MCTGQTGGARGGEDRWRVAFLECSLLCLLCFHLPFPLKTLLVLLVELPGILCFLLTSLTQGCITAILVSGARGPCWPHPHPHRAFCHPGSAAASSVLAALPLLSRLASHRLPLCVPPHGPPCLSSWLLHGCLDPYPGSGFSCAILAPQGMTSLFRPCHCCLWRGLPREGPRRVMWRGSSSPLC